jgi:hypothetical protein
MQAIEERWGLFLKHADFNNIELLKRRFEELIQDITKGYEENNVIKNPAYYIRLGNSLIEHANRYKTKALNSINFVGKVIKQSLIP